ncbi:MULTISPECIES: hypothetical protein [unclassified Myroides]|uniref:hypothetical protein n=1 Tax=unclassified Myroides TaxID=2642485 RepID=UPI0015F83892|nr:MULTISPECIES: hypothetical protein [unclassified Myroides]MBB1149288.1 hypothetical protein [Myroides sp. NP-2]MDM1408256.1 hypothetical protein [Myroides sp. DF42-4-2]
MRVRDLFVLVVKLVAGGLLIDVLVLNLPLVLYQIGMKEDVMGTNAMELVHILLLLVGLVLLFVYAGHIVDFFRVEKGFSNLTIPSKSLTMIGLTQLGVFFVGLRLIVDNLPSLVSNALFWFKAKSVNNPYEYVQTGNFWFVTLFNIVLGYLLISHMRKIALWVIPNQEEQE